MGRFTLLITLVFVLLSSNEAVADTGPVAELQAGGDFGVPVPWVMGSVSLGWRITERWSAGISYSPVRAVFQDISTGNDTSVQFAMVSGLHLRGDYWFKTHDAWGGRAGVQLGALSPQLGVEMPSGYMEGAAAEALATASYGWVGEHVGVQLFAKAGWKWGRIENDTRERGMTGEGPVIVYHHDISEPTFILGLTLLAWL